VTDVTFFKTSPKKKPKKSGGTWDTTSRPYEKVEGHVPSVPHQTAPMVVVRAGLKPMQPMQLDWALRLWGPPPWCLGRLFIFARYSLRLRIQ